MSMFNGASARVSYEIHRGDIFASLSLSLTADDRKAIKLVKWNPSYSGTVNLLQSEMACWIVKQYKRVQKKNKEKQSNNRCDENLTLMQCSTAQKKSKQVAIVSFLVQSRFSYFFYSSSHDWTRGKKSAEQQKWADCFPLLLIKNFMMRGKKHRKREERIVSSMKRLPVEVA